MKLSNIYVLVLVIEASDASLITDSSSDQSSTELESAVILDSSNHIPDWAQTWNKFVGQVQSYGGKKNETEVNDSGGFTNDFTNAIQKFLKEYNPLSNKDNSKTEHSSNHNNLTSSETWSWPSFWPISESLKDNTTQTIKQPDPAKLSEKVIGGNVQNEGLKSKTRFTTQVVPTTDTAKAVDDKASSEPPTNLLPPSSVIDHLRCFPIMSFSSCVQHCAESLPYSTEGVNLGDELLVSNINPFERKGRFLAIKSDKDTEKSARKKVMGDLDSKLIRRIMDVQQAQQFKICIHSICVPDYMVAAIPGCINSEGLVIPPNVDTGLDELEGKPMKYHLEDGDYKELDFYDPSRVHFYRDTGLFRLKRIWDNIVPENSVTGWLMVPIWFMCIAIILPAALYWGYSSMLNIWIPSNNNAHGGVRFYKCGKLGSCSSLSRQHDGHPLYLCDSFVSDHPVWAAVQSVAVVFGSFLRFVMSSSRFATNIMTNMIDSNPFQASENINSSIQSDSNSIELEQKQSGFFDSMKRRADGYFVVPSEPIAAIPLDRSGRTVPTAPSLN